VSNSPTIPAVDLKSFTLVKYRNADLQLGIVG
jgi:hypothetical protein